MPMPTIDIEEKDMTPEQRILWNLTSINSSLNDVRTKVDKHHKVLVEGNGELPLVERVRNVESFNNSLKYWMRFLVGAILVQTVAFGAAAIIYFLKLYPILESLTQVSK